MAQSQIFDRFGAVLTYTVALILLLSGPAIAEPSALHHFQIAPQGLSSALEAFAAATGTQVLYDRPVGGEPRSNGVAGDLTREQALLAILRGTGLAARFDGPNDIVLGPAETLASQLQSGGPPPIGVPMLTLDTLEANSASADDSFAQELYVNQIRNGVRQALLADRRTSSGEYAVTLRLWISVDGRVQNAKLMNPTGDADRDKAIEEILLGLRIDAKAPPRIAQPVLIGIHSRPAG